MPRLSAAVTVTVADPASSATLSGSRLSVIAVGTDSSSLIVSVAVPAVSPDALALSTTVSSPSSSLSSSGVKVKLAVPLAWRSGIVSARLLTAA